MRIAIREQLVLLVTLTVLVALAVVALPTWFFVHRFVIDVRKDSLALTASLKASKIAADLELVRSSCRTISSRILIQKALDNWYISRVGGAWGDATTDLEIALSSGSQTQLLQARIYTRDGSGPPGGIVNVTGLNVPRIRLPYDSPDGSPVYFGDSEDENSYPSALYPNITYGDSRPSENSNVTRYEAYVFGDLSLNNPRGILLGPLSINSSFALISVTLPIWDYETRGSVLGFLTIVAEATSLIQHANSPEGLGDTGMVLLVGPGNPANKFNKTTGFSDYTVAADDDSHSDVDVHFVLPAQMPKGQKDRHQGTADDYGNNRMFPASDYPAVLQALQNPPHAVNNASSLMPTKNEFGVGVAVGFARTTTPLADWVVVVEQSREEAYRPIDTLTKILLACVFGTAGVIFILSYPCAHIGVLPIRRLKSATERTISPPGYEEGADGYFGQHIPSGDGTTPGSGTHSSQQSQGSIKGWFGTMLTHVGVLPTPAPKLTGDSAVMALRPFKIPSKVRDRKHVITDELTELTTTFNEMSDELLKQYTRLDEKVAERTRELEISKKAAEAANESKTLFIANISHELKTPLNGILGMCAVCMEEEDVDKIKQSLGTLYKSGDLLLHLLEDLLSFSKNQIGQNLYLEQKEFGLADIRSQIQTIFDKQVNEGGIKFSVFFLHADSVEAVTQEKSGLETKIAAIGPQGTGRMKDMRLYGDQHRILQVIINLVSNSLKFTPRGGKVEVRIKCLGEVEEGGHTTSRSSSSSKRSNSATKGRKTSVSARSGSARSKQSSGSPATHPVAGTAITINPMERKISPPVYVRGRSPTPPPPNAKMFMFEFEVEDTGPGIPEDMQQRVFEPFVQGDWGLSRKFGGTGLGLSICQQLANLMGGNITLRSTMGVGTVFTMRIPLKYVKDRTPSTTSSSIRSHKLDDAAPEARPISAAGPNVGNDAAVLAPQPRLVGLRQPYFASHHPPETNADVKIAAAVEKTLEAKTLEAKTNGTGPCGKLRVLVADDNSTNVEVVSRMLRLEEVYDVTVAKDGQEAYEQVRAAMAEDRGFDVIFMDVQMPNVDGLQSTRLIRRMGYKSPIVALTAFAEESNVRECLESGMDEFLSKPIRRVALKEVLWRFATIPEEEEEGTTPGDEKGEVLGDGVAPGA